VRRVPASGEPGDKVSNRKSLERSHSSTRDAPKSDGHAQPAPGVLTPSHCLALQRTAGNSAIQQLLSRQRSPATPRAILQRLATPLTFTDLGRADREPNAAAANNWLHETILQINYNRLGIEDATKTAVNAFADGDGLGVYKHYVPSHWITWSIFALLVNPNYAVSRDMSIPWLRLKMENLDLTDTSGLDPRDNRAAFNAWFSWVIDQFADWPNNIYRWTSSTGDRGGRQLDTPTDKPTAAVPPALTARLQEAHGTLASEFRVRQPPEWNVA
jgi:hypothetical protein